MTFYIYKNVKFECVEMNFVCCRLEKYDLLIINEISMVSSRTVLCMSAISQSVKDAHTPFGGVQKWILYVVGLKCDLLIIDEISMVSSRIVLSMSAVLLSTKDTTTPFWRVRHISGDFYQLPPVPNDSQGDPGEPLYLLVDVDKYILHKIELIGVRPDFCFQCYWLCLSFYRLLVLVWRCFIIWNVISHIRINL